MSEQLPADNNKLLFQGLEHVQFENKLRAFYHFVLCALVIERQKFLADYSFHAAYADMMATEGAKHMDPKLYETLTEVDDIFATYSHADRLLFRGQNDGIIGFMAPQNIIAVSRISEKTASDTLMRSHNHEIWRILGKTLSDSLTGF